MRELEQLDADVLALRERRVRRLGILGGTFDPIHNGHIGLCRAALAEYSLDAVLLLVNGQPPHKRHVSDKEHRYRMAHLAAQDCDGVLVSRLEIDRQGRMYTVDSLGTLRAALPDCAFFYIIGMDTLYELTDWSKAEDVYALTNFLCFSRPGCENDEARVYINKHLASVRDKFFFADAPGLPLSSTQIRRRTAQGLDISADVSGKVAAYIVENGLYRDETMSFDQAAVKLEKALSRQRFAHTMGVLRTGEMLAKRYDVPLQKVRWACLLHDCAKEYSVREQIKSCVRAGIVLDEQTLLSPQLIHALLGAHLAKTDYGMEDEEVLNAIRLHTTGGESMSTVDKIVYLADMIEPSRDFARAEELRKMAGADLNGAVLSAMEGCIAHVLERGDYLHPGTVFARNAFWRRQKAEISHDRTIDERISPEILIKRNET